jgi:hypothetical protein
VEDYRTVRLRYNAAFDAHREVAAQNARRSIEGDPVSLEEVMIERHALKDLDAARRALLASLEPNRDEH